VWPIDPEAGHPPAGWTGWPEQKKFALVLSHDVDTAEGHDRCLQLMQLEEKLGFRSSFNFVPEGYPVSPELRRELTERGFDVGVHGLVHDANLFRSREIFEERACRINHYLKEWGAAGFHSPATLRNLDWIGELDIEYDGSTFDTDPFEPQPDGVRTIFPFVVHKKSGQLLTTAEKRPPTDDHRRPLKNNDRRKSVEQRAGSEEQRGKTTANKDQRPRTADSMNPTNSSNPMNPSNSMDSSNPIDSMNSTNPSNCYIELPYTLPQDHCLFVILKAKDISIWKEKLDWVAAKGGMALLNSHPDYMNFEKRECRLEEYDASMYMAFLQYAKSKYEGQYWHALPREIAKFWKRAMVR
jgi:hypothetical protein